MDWGTCATGLAHANSIIERFSNLQLTVIQICYEMIVHIKKKFRRCDRPSRKNRSAKQAEKNVTAVHMQFQKPQQHICSISINGAKGSIIEDAMIRFDISIYHVDSNSTCQKGCC